MEVGEVEMETWRSYCRTAIGVSEITAATLDCEDWVAVQMLDLKLLGWCYRQKCFVL